MSDWKDQLRTLEIEPPADAWNNIEQKRKSLRYKKWLGGGIVLLATTISLTMNYFRDQNELPVSTSQLYSKTSPDLLTNEQPTTEIRNQKFEAEISHNKKSASEEADYLSSANLTSFPYNGRIISQQTQPAEIEIQEELNQSTINDPIQEETIAEYNSEELTQNHHVEEDSTFANVKIEIPNVFSPNQDGWNDEFRPELYLPQHFQFIEWHLFQEGKHLQTWNENSDIWKGQDAAGYPQPGGSYQYIIHYIDNHNNHQYYKGSIYLQR